jgi:predicted ATPase
MRRIRECYRDPERYKEKTGLPPITPDDVAVLYVERQGDQSVVKEMYLDDQGYLIDEWPGDFFSERLNELI